jgi:signal transduction histidine kinase/CheY-like chemotaxis protein
MIPSADPGALRVFIFAPVGRDAALTRELLGRSGIPSTVCASIDEVCDAVDEGTVAALVLTEEVFDLPDCTRIGDRLRAQPPWSDIAVVLFAGSEGRTTTDRTVDLLEPFPTVTLVDRPVRIAVAVSIVRAALRGRARQLEVRDLLLALRAERERVEEASRLKDEFLAMLSHELRTPLNAILGWSSMLLHGAVDPAARSRGIEVIDRNARAQAQLVEDVLDMARIITGKLRMEMRTVPLAAVIQAAVEAAAPAAEARDIHIDTRGVEDGCLVRADPDRMQQVLWNLLSNAIKFTPRGGAVSVRSGRPDDSVRITVTDSGIGMDPAFVPYVFDRFRQADQSVTRGHGGLGLGLAIVKHLVELHGGSVEASSPGLGRGSTFSITLPMPAVATDEGALAGHAAAHEAFDLRFPGRRILVVDDDVATRELLSELFTRAGALVMTAESAATAFAALPEEPPDVIVADVGMPIEDGCSLIRRIRQLPPPLGAVPAIALSAYTRAEDRAAAREAGFTHFVGKPATPDVLLRAVERLLAS